MCWPEADLDLVQGVTGLEKAGPVSAAPSGSRSVGGCCVSPEQWVSGGVWLGPDLEVPPSSPHGGLQPVPLSEGAHSVDTGQDPAPISESMGDCRGVLVSPIVNDGLGWGQARQGLRVTLYSEPRQ